MKAQLHCHVTGTGVETYRNGLTQALRDLDVNTIETAPNKREWIIAGKRVGGYITMRLGSRWVKKPSDVNVLHAMSNWVYPIQSDSVMVHDLNPLILKGWGVSAAMFERQKQRLKKSILITPTEGTRQALAYWLGIDPDLITVAYHGIDFKGQPSKIKGKEFLLYVGDYRDYKKVQESIILARKLNMAFVRAGPPANDGYGFACKNLGYKILGSNFIELDYVSKTCLKGLYQQATAVTFLSSWEGAGLPPLEAANCGTPSILADTPINRELHGDRAIYYRLDDPISNKELLEQIHYWNEKSYVLQLFVQRYTWKKSALAHIDAWKRGGLI